MWCIHKVTCLVLPFFYITPQTPKKKKRKKKIIDYTYLISIACNKLEQFRHLGPYHA